MEDDDFGDLYADLGTGAAPQDDGDESLVITREEPVASSTKGSIFDADDDEDDYGVKPQQNEVNEAKQGGANGFRGDVVYDEEPAQQPMVVAARVDEDDSDSDDDDLKIVLNSEPSLIPFSEAETNLLPPSTIIENADNSSGGLFNDSDNQQVPPEQPPLPPSGLPPGIMPPGLMPPGLSGQGLPGPPRPPGKQPFQQHMPFNKYVRAPVPGMGPGGPQNPGMRFPPGQWRPMPRPGMPWFPQQNTDFHLPPTKTVFDMDLDALEDKPWRHPGVDMTDYFNFGFNEISWKAYCQHLSQVRIEATMQTKISVYESGRSEPLVGRAIQVENGVGERRASHDIPKRNRSRDADPIIEIVLKDFEYSPPREGESAEDDKMTPSSRMDGDGPPFFPMGPRARPPYRMFPGQGPRGMRPPFYEPGMSPLHVRPDGLPMGPGDYDSSRKPSNRSSSRPDEEPSAGSIPVKEDKEDRHDHKRRRDSHSSRSRDGGDNSSPSDDESRKVTRRSRKEGDYGDGDRQKKASTSDGKERRHDRERRDDEKRSHREKDDRYNEDDVRKPRDKDEDVRRQRDKEDDIRRQRDKEDDLRRQKEKDDDIRRQQRDDERRRDDERKREEHWQRKEREKDRGDDSWRREREDSQRRSSKGYDEGYERRDRDEGYERRDRDEGYERRDRDDDSRSSKRHEKYEKYEKAEKYEKVKEDDEYLRRKSKDESRRREYRDSRQYEEESYDRKAATTATDKGASRSGREHSVDKQKDSKWSSRRNGDYLDDRDRKKQRKPEEKVQSREYDEESRKASKASSRTEPYSTRTEESYSSEEDDDGRRRKGRSKMERWNRERPLKDEWIHG